MELVKKMSLRSSANTQLCVNVEKKKLKINLGNSEVQWRRLFVAPSLEMPNVKKNVSF